MLSAPVSLFELKIGWCIKQIQNQQTKQTTVFECQRDDLEGNAKPKRVPNFTDWLTKRKRMLTDDAKKLIQIGQ